MDRATALEKKGSWHNLQHDGWPIYGSIPSFSSWCNHWSSGGKATLCWWQATRLNGSIYQHAIGTFNTCSWGSTHWSLTNIGRGYNPECADFPYHTPWSSQPAVSTFHQRAPPDLQFNQLPPTKPKFKFKEPMAVTESSDHSVIYQDLHLRLANANDLSLAIGITRIDWKWTLYD
jgi:hypothetical protein